MPFQNIAYDEKAKDNYHGTFHNKSFKTFDRNGKTFFA